MTSTSNLDDIDQLYASGPSSTTHSLSIKQLQVIVQNEKYAPELLDYKPIINEFLNRINERDAEINSDNTLKGAEDAESLGDNSESQYDSFHLSGGVGGQNLSSSLDTQETSMQQVQDTSMQQVKAYKMIKLLELDKIRFLIAEYFRIRRKKIELFSHYLLHAVENGNTALLSDLEVQFAKKFSALEIEYYKQGFQESMENSYWESEEFLNRLRERKPDDNQVVFVRLAEGMKSIEIVVDDQPLKLGVGETSVYSYRTVRDRVLRGELVLV